MPEPEDGVATVWSNSPVVVWQGSLEWIKVYPSGEAPPETGLILSDYTDPSLHTLSLGQTLQPGQAYNLQFQAAPDLAPSPVYQLRTLSRSDQAQVAADLQALADQGGTAEEIAIRQATYFAERQLWVDFWQTVTAVQNPSPEFKQEVQDIVNLVCPPASASPSSQAS